jgi:hypothetical protein
MTTQYEWGSLSTKAAGMGEYYYENKGYIYIDHIINTVTNSYIKSIRN